MGAGAGPEGAHGGHLPTVRPRTERERPYQQSKRSGDEVNTLYSTLPPLFRPAKAQDVRGSDFVGKVRHATNVAFNPWPDSLPDLGARTIGAYDPCGCGRWSWVRYGGKVICFGCARLKRASEA